MILEKALTQLAMPCGVIWLGLMLLTWLAWREKRWKSAIGLFVLLAAYTTFGNLWVNKALLACLERDYVGIRPLEEGPFDAVVILSGGTNETPTGEPQFGKAGDRVLLGARLYLSGRTPRLVCTGRGIEGFSAAKREPGEQTALLLKDLGIPDEHVLRLPGRNTSEEMQAIKHEMVRRQWKRVGLITSAWHMARAMRLAKNAGLDVAPLPADFRSTPQRWSPVWLIPDGGSLEESSMACKEFLAGLIGR